MNNLRKAFLKLSFLSIVSLAIISSISIDNAVQADLLAPQVNTSAATSITNTSATLNGTLTSLGSSTSVIVFFEYGTNSNYGNTIAAPAMASPGPFSASVNGLSPATSYHFRAKADNGGLTDTFIGTDMTFTTTSILVPIPPIASTLAATAITDTSATLAGTLTSLGSAASVNVFFEYGNTLGYGNTVAAQTMIATGPFSASVNGLSPRTTYHFRAKADGGLAGTATGPDLTFTTANTPASTPPVVGTLAATSISNTSATLNGTLTSLGSSTSISVFFEYGTTTNYGNTVAPQQKITTGSFSVTVDVFVPGMTYHFRAKADNGGVTGAAEGLDMTFTTTAAPALIPPMAGTYGATSITPTSATLNGALISVGDAINVSVFFEYGTTTDYGSTIAPPAMTTLGSFSIIAGGLAPSTTYHFRAKADGGLAGIALGPDMSFNTPAFKPPTAETYDATAINITSATLNGMLKSLGTATSVDVFFEYGTTTDYGSTIASRVMTTAGSFKANVSGLTLGTTYHFRAKTDAGINGVSTTPDMTFTTLKKPPFANMWFLILLAIALAEGIFFFISRKRKGKHTR